jgi:hypothetical protein
VVSCRRKTLASWSGTVKLAESWLGRSRVGRVKGRDEDASRPDLHPEARCLGGLAGSKEETYRNFYFELVPIASGNLLDRVE